MKVVSDEKLRKRLAKMLALQCFRNSKLEDHHGGVFPSSKTGDYTDVKVVTPYGEIEWNQLSRISDEEMKELMIDVVDRTYLALTNLNNTQYKHLLTQALKEHDVEPGWQEPKIPEDVVMMRPDGTFEL